MIPHSTESRISYRCLALRFSATEVKAGSVFCLEPDFPFFLDPTPVGTVGFDFLFFLTMVEIVDEPGDPSKNGQKSICGKKFNRS